MTLSCVMMRSAQLTHVTCFYFYGSDTDFSNNSLLNDCNVFTNNHRVLRKIFLGIILYISGMLHKFKVKELNFF